MKFIDKIKKAKQLIKEATENYEKIGVSCSFGKDSMVLLHLCKKVKADIEIFSVDSDTEFQETYDFIEKIASDWNLNHISHTYKQADIAKETPDQCCNERKVTCFKKAVENYETIITGVRKTEGKTRTDFKYIEKGQGLQKINPILTFSEKDIWRYCAIYNIPLNPKYQEGYRSLGCAICSTPEQKEDEDERDGRWRGTKREGGECNIHTCKLK